jgi:hypothetical protein
MVGQASPSHPPRTGVALHSVALDHPADPARGADAALVERRPLALHDRQLEKVEMILYPIDANQQGY